MRAFLDIVGTLEPNDRTIESRAPKPFEANRIRHLTMDDVERMWRAPRSYSLPGRRNEDGRSANQQRMAPPVVGTPEMVEITR